MTDASTHGATPSGPVADFSAEYRLLDFGLGQRLEQWGPVRLVRPDPRALDAPRLDMAEWGDAHARFEGRVGQGAWQRQHPVPDAWTITHGGLQFEVALAPSMHTGLFPEQIVHWRWMIDALAPHPTADVLNLFAYTGAASVALAAAGHRVTHVDASRASIGWAQRNAALNGLSSIRWLHDDVRTFVLREVRRGRRYAAILLDPPVFGRSGRGKTWHLETDLSALLTDLAALMAPNASFLLLNAYLLDHAPFELEDDLATALAARPDLRGQISAASLDLVSWDGRSLPTGAYARWEAARS